MTTQVKTMLPRTLGAIGALIVFTGTAQAALRPSAINSEREAAAGLLTAFQMRTEVPWQVAVLTYRTRDYTDRAMRILAANTTPAALFAANDGQNFPCDISGTVHARLSRTLPRTLKLEWTNCVFDTGLLHNLTGPAEVVLPGDTFTPATVKSIRLGNSSRDLTDELRLLFGEPDQVPTTNTFNLRMTGLVPMARANENDIFQGAFAYELSGRAYERFYFFMAGEGDTLFSQEMSVSATNGFVSGFLDYGRRDDLRVSGTFDWWMRQDASSQAPEYRDSSRIVADGLRLQTVWDEGAGANLFSIDGRVDYTWPEGWGMNCACGTVYSYDTRVPARHVPQYNDTPFFDAGRIVMNDTATARFSAVGNPDEGQVLSHIDLDVRRVGNFDYEIDGYNLGSLQDAARCPE
jgi:hypothetical protein